MEKVKFKNKIKALSLFSNVGMAETYLEELGVEVVVANELLPERGMFYNHLYPKANMIVGDITNDDFNEFYSGIKVVTEQHSFFELWISHGVKPQNETYSYVMLPDDTVKRKLLRYLIFNKRVEEIQYNKYQLIYTGIFEKK